MLLYHVSIIKKEEDPTRKFIPRIPSSISKTENQDIKRICFAPSVEQCFEAIQSKGKEISPGTKFLLFSLNTDNLNKEQYISNETIVKNNWVYDAKETGETWIVKELELTGKRYILESYNMDFILLFSRIKISDIFNALEELGRKELIKTDLCKAENSYDLYIKLLNYFDKKEDYDIQDDLFDYLAMNVKQCQGFSMRKLEYSPI